MKSLNNFIFSLLLLISLIFCTVCTPTSPPSQAHRFEVKAFVASTDKKTFLFNMKALDSSGNLVKNYAAKVQIATTDSLAILPDSVMLKDGIGSFSGTFKTAGVQTLKATDTVNTAIMGTSNAFTVVSVSTAITKLRNHSTSHLLVTAPSTVSVGSSFNFTVNALDASNGLVSNDSPTIHFASTDSQVTLPLDATLKNGTGVFSATLQSVGKQNLSVTDTINGSIKGVSNTITVKTNSTDKRPVDHFSVIAPSAALGGSLFSFTVKALDAANNLVNTYSETVHFASTDATATLPIDSLLKDGIGNFSVLMQKADHQTITVTDKVNSTIKGTSNPISISGASPANTLDVLTHHNDTSRTGQYLSETVLTPSSVKATSFGKLFSRPLDGQIYGQPLYKHHVTIPGLGVHNVVYVATMHNSVYAFDADSNSGPNAEPLWHRTFIDPATRVTSVPISDYPDYRDIKQEIGILSTPVIDPSTGTLYCVAKTKETSEISPKNRYGHVYRLHALDLATGQEKFGGPVALAGSVRGTGDGSVKGIITFDPYLHNQRGALLLAHGTVYFGYSSYGGRGDYHGWLMAYNAYNLRQIAVWNTTPNNPAGSGKDKGQAGIWMNSSGPASDDSSIYISTANGYFDTKKKPVTNFGTSVVKLSSSLSVVDYFSPSNQETLTAEDFDISAGGILLLPPQPGIAPNLMLAAGKDGVVYLMNRDSLGKHHAKDQVIQKAAVFPGLSSSPAYWNNFIYYKGSTKIILVKNPTPFYAFKLIPGTAKTSTTINFKASSQSLESWGWPGSTPSISANVKKNGIAWVIQADFTFDKVPVSGGAILKAYDAMNLAHKLYDSSVDPKDQLGQAIKFTLPTVANAKVYVGADALSPTSSFPSELTVFGLK